MPPLPNSTIEHDRASGGYTLVELLVVISVVGVLAAVLLPVFESVKLAAKGTEDLENIGQLARSASIYSEDADKTFIAAGAPTMDPAWSPARDKDRDAAGKPWMGWGLRLAPYTRSFDAFKSPLYPKSATFSGHCAYASGMRLTNNYALNWFLSADGTFGDGTDARDEYAWSPDGSRRFNHPVPVAEIVSPANTVTFMVSSAVSPTRSSNGCLAATVQASDFTTEMGRSAVRSEGANFALADGHARFIEEEHLTVFNSGDQAAQIHHLRSRSTWMEPTMPQSTLGFQNADRQNHPIGDL